MKILSEKVSNTNIEMVYDSEWNISLEQAIEKSWDYITIAIDCSAHSNTIQNYDARDVQSSIKLPTGIDGVLLSWLKGSQKKYQIALLTADCAPISFVSKDGDTIALLHGGWQGISTGILENFVHIVQSKKTDTGTLYVHIGPMIGDYYEFQKEDVTLNFWYIFEKYHLSIDEYVFLELWKTYFKLRGLIIDILKALWFWETHIVFQNVDTNDYKNIIPSHRLHMSALKLSEEAKKTLWIDIWLDRELRKSISWNLVLTPEQKAFFESEEFEFYLTRKRMMTYIRN